MAVAGLDLGINQAIGRRKYRRGEEGPLSMRLVSGGGRRLCISELNTAKIAAFGRK
jgi:hypothetical protein